MRYLITSSSNSSNLLSFVSCCGNCPDNLEREIESLKKSKAHYAKLKFEIYDDYTKANITRDQMAKKTAEVKQKIAEIESLITEKQETLDMQKDLFLDAKQEQLTKLSKLDEFDEEVIRYLIDYVLVYDNEHIEIRWNFDDFQAKPEIWFEIIHDFFVAVSGTMMRFIYDNCIKMVLVQMISDTGNSKEEQLANFRHLTSDERVSYVMNQAEYLLNGQQSLFCYLISMYQKQHFSKTQLAHSKR